MSWHILSVDDVCMVWCSEIFDPFIKEIKQEKNNKTDIKEGWAVRLKTVLLAI